MPDVATVLYSALDIRRRVDELGRAITDEYRERDLVLVSVLKCVDLSCPTELDLDAWHSAGRRFARGGVRSPAAASG